jgi:hypothetical protein
MIAKFLDRRIFTSSVSAWLRHSDQTLHAAVQIVSSVFTCGSVKLGGNEGQQYVDFMG